MSKKYNRNIKILVFFYIFFVGLVSYMIINAYWWVMDLIKGKRQLV